VYDIQQIQDAHSVFLHLLQHKIVKKTDSGVEAYFNDMQIQLLVKKLADSANTQVLVGGTNIHLVTKAKGSIFATNFTQMKEQFKDRKSDVKVETRNELYLVHLVIMIYLSEVDGETTKGSHLDLYGGIRYLEIADRVTQVLNHWKRLLETDDTFAQRQKIALPQLINEWDTKRLQPDEDERIRSSGKTKYSIVQTAMRLLEEEKLVKIYEQRVTALEALHERLEQIYHSEQRYRDWKKLIEDAETGDIA
jgi:hypothetical protein